MNADEPLRFVDTNVLVYAYDRSAGEKPARAISPMDKLCANARGCLSVQVLQEFYIAVTKKVLRPTDLETAGGSSGIFRTGGLMLP